MKIAQITNVFPPYKAGMGQVSWHYAEELYKLGEEVEVITPDYGTPLIPPLSRGVSGSSTDKGRLGGVGFKIKYLKPIFKWGLGSFCPQIIFKLNKYDVIQLHYPAYGTAIFVWLWRVFIGRKKKLFIFYHMDNVGSSFLGLIFKFYAKLITPLILKSADYIQVSSIDYAENSNINKLLKKYPAKFIEIPFGVTNDYNPNNKNLDLYKEFNIDASKKLIYFVGGMRREHYFKGVGYLLKALAKLNFQNWHFVALGAGELIDDYKKLSKELKIEEKVTFTGYQSDEVKRDFYKLAYVTVLPSIDKSEAFGVVLVEAQSCGSPVIASDLPGVRTTLENGKTGFLIKPKDVDDLKNKLEKILENNKLRDEMSVNASKRVQEKYQWSKIGDKLLKIYST